MGAAVAAAAAVGAPGGGGPQALPPPRFASFLVQGGGDLPRVDCSTGASSSSFSAPSLNRQLLTFGRALRRGEPLHLQQALVLERPAARAAQADAAATFMTAEAAVSVDFDEGMGKQQWLYAGRLAPAGTVVAVGF